MTRQEMVTTGLNAWQRRQFEYGSADCCQFVAHMIKSLGGPDYSKFVEYESESEAYEIIQQHGSLNEFVGSILGEPSADLQDGDPVLCVLPIVGEVMGVKLRDGVVCLVERGMIQLSNKYTVRGWAICHR